jgi:probable DNA metabolism protein
VRRIGIEPRFDAWRDAARGLLAEGVPPEGVVWAESEEQDLLPMFDAGPGAGPASKASLRISRRFLDLARAVACHGDPGRWALLYRLLWRQAHGEPQLLDNEVDGDVRRLAALEKAVRRDSHKMKAFVRFRRMVDEDGVETFVAWHRPDYDIVERVAPFFADRFGVMRWSILTPRRSAHWDLEKLSFGPGLTRDAAPDDDELEDLWRTYYASIFNPARVKLKAMRAEMPVRHWTTLPETAILPDLLRQAPGRVETMIEHSRRPTAREFFPPEPDLSVWAAACQRCTACDLCERATRAVFGQGPAQARVMLVGEQPGDQEDRTGQPFVGPAGQVLDDALAEVGIAREEVYLTNAVKHFKFEPRGKRRIHRTPTLGEAAACRPWLEAEIALVKPERIVCLGATAARSLLGAEFRLTRQRGEVFTSTAWAPWVMATYHPSALLRIPDEMAKEEARRQFLADLRKAADGPYLGESTFRNNALPSPGA